MKKKRRFVYDPNDETTLCGVPLEGDTVFTVEEFNEWMDAVIEASRDEREDKE